MGLVIVLNEGARRQKQLYALFLLLLLPVVASCLRNNWVVVSVARLLLQVVLHRGEVVLAVSLHCIVHAVSLLKE